MATIPLAERLRPHTLDEYEVIVSPFLACADENGFKERITEWVKQGGTWIVGPMSDIMDGNVNRYTHAPYGFLEELAGVYRSIRSLLQTTFSRHSGRTTATVKSACATTLTSA